MQKLSWMTLPLQIQKKEKLLCIPFGDLPQKKIAEHSITK